MFLQISTGVSSGYHPCLYVDSIMTATRALDLDRHGFGNPELAASNGTRQPAKEKANSAIEEGSGTSVLITAVPRVPRRSVWLTTAPRCSRRRNRLSRLYSCRWNPGSLT